MNIAITGGIGAGKSTVLRFVPEFFPNAKFFSFDKLVDELYQDESWLSYLKENFLTSDRKEISMLAFKEETIRQEIMGKSSLLLGVKLGKLLSSNEGLNFVEVPLLFESILQDEFDLTVLITAPTKVRIDRAVARDKKTPEQVQAIIDKQMNEEEKMKLADIVIDTGYCDICDAVAKLVWKLDDALKGKYKP